MSVEQKLSQDKFIVDEGNPHIQLNADALDDETKQALTKVCPAGLYTLDAQGGIVFDSAGCLECGACRVTAANRPGALKWNHPRPGFGVQYRFG